MPTSYDNPDPTLADAMLVSRLELANYSQIAVSALLIYDIIITLDKEVEYFWVLPFSLTNLSFFLIRYAAVLRGIISIYSSTGTLMVDAFMYACVFFMCVLLEKLNSYDEGKLTIWGTSLMDWTIILCMDYILFLRVRAMYSFETRYKKLVVCLQVLYVLDAAVGIGSLISYTLSEELFPHFISDNMGFCDNKRALVGLRSLFWAAPLAYESILMALALYKAVEVRESLGFRGLNLIKLIIYDQAVYFIFVMVCSVANIVANLGPVRNTSTFLFFFSVIGGAELLTLLGSRMLIHLKEAVERKPEVEESFKISSDVSVAEFRTYSRIEDPYLAHCAGSSISQGMDSAPELPLSIQAVEL